MDRKPDLEVIEIIRLVRLCQNLNGQPSPGGILDQDSYLMYLFQAVFDADLEKEANRNKRHEAELARLRSEGRR